MVPVARMQHLVLCIRSPTGERVRTTVARMPAGQHLNLAPSQSLGTTSQSMHSCACRPERWLVCRRDQQALEPLDLSTYKNKNGQERAKRMRLWGDGYRPWPAACKIPKQGIPADAHLLRVAPCMAEKWNRGVFCAVSVPATCVTQAGPDLVCPQGGEAHHERGRQDGSPI